MAWQREKEQGPSKYHPYLSPEEISEVKTDGITFFETPKMYIPSSTIDNKPKEKNRNSITPTLLFEKCQENLTHHDLTEPYKFSNNNNNFKLIEDDVVSTVSWKDATNHYENALLKKEEERLEELRTKFPKTELEHDEFVHLERLRLCREQKNREIKDNITKEEKPWKLPFTITIDNEENSQIKAKPDKEVSIDPEFQDPLWEILSQDIANRVSVDNGVNELVQLYKEVELEKTEPMTPERIFEKTQELIDIQIKYEKQHKLIIDQLLLLCDKVKELREQIVDLKASQ